MADGPRAPIVFRVSGVNVGSGGGTRGGTAEPEPFGEYETKHSIAVTASRGDPTIDASAVPGEDIVMLEIGGGPKLYLHPETARDLMNAQGQPQGRGGAASDAGDGVAVPVQLNWPAVEMGAAANRSSRGLGGVLLKAFKVLTGIGKDPIAEFAVSQIVAKADGQVDEGIYPLSSGPLPTQLKGSVAKLTEIPATSKPVLVLVHGTFSDTVGTFGKLWTEQSGIVNQLFVEHPGGVFGLDHRTLAVSPIANALSLAKSLPANTRVRLLTHSRGGLVAEVFARVCAEPDAAVQKFKSVLATAQSTWEKDTFDLRQKAFDTQLQELTALAAEVKARNLAVERMVRVACPVRGTLLASKRLDAYISVLKWALELAHIPIAPELIGLIGAIAQRKADPAELPGLEAQMPDSVMVQWLHAIETPLPGDLRVIAGDMQGDSVISWLKTLVADSFYWTDHDLVVQTRSMYGGAPRANNSLFVFDQGASVSHFNYFKNERTAKAVLAGLTQNKPVDFSVIGPMSWAGQSSDGVRGGASKAPDKPLVFVIPGIVGTNLKVGTNRIWLGLHILNGFEKLVYPDAVVEPDGPIESTYDSLVRFLQSTHEVVEFGFDWRKPIEEEAKRLAAAVTGALDDRVDSKRPVRIVAHSMGGVLTRVMELEQPDVWKRMLDHPDARILMLGTPNGGSWAPMQVLSGDDRFGNMLAMVGAPFHSYDARQIIAGFPGLLQLQAGVDDPARLGSAQVWADLAAADLDAFRRESLWHRLPLQLQDRRWGLPSTSTLGKAAALRVRLDAQLARAPEIFGAKVVHVLGHADLTPVGYDEPTNTYLNVRDDGDGRVSRESATLPGVKMWSVNADHGSLPNVPSAFDGYLELLVQGDTKRLTSVTAPTVGRGATSPPPALERTRPARSLNGGPPVMLPADALRSRDEQGAPGVETRPALKVKVVHGDLSFVGEPLLLGHYRSLRMTGTESVMNRLIGGTMQTSLSLGHYPLEPGSSQVFENIVPHPFRGLPRPQAVIVVGLGDEGALQPSELVETVKHGVLAWAQRAAEGHKHGAQAFELAATLIGSGGIGISAGEAAQCIVRAVCEANVLLSRGDGNAQWPLAGSLSLIELYLDRATEAWSALHELDVATPGLVTLEPYLQPSTGALRRTPGSGYRGADYDLISTVTEERPDGPRISYSIDTKRARTEVRAKPIQLKLIRHMVQSASNEFNNDPDLGRALFRLVVPQEIVPFFSGSSAMVMELDKGTAGIPWELLDTMDGDPSADPWAIRTKLLRKLRVTDPQTHFPDANADADVLVIGEPSCAPKAYPRLPGARAEAMDVAARLKQRLDPLNGGVVKPVIRGAGADGGPDAQSVITALLSRPWRIIHIAGHGEAPDAARVDACGKPVASSTRGVVLSNDLYLGPDEIRSMPAIPELVFVNCCYLAARDANETLAYDRSSFAAGVAQSLIEAGVRCVIAAGWAVDDAAAREFANTFYASLLDGERFIDAVTSARVASRRLGSNTWAAYQCYGDPDWTFNRKVNDAQHPRSSSNDELATITSQTALKLTLEMVAVTAATNLDAYSGLADKLTELERRYWSQYGSKGEIAEGFGLAWNELGDRARALPFLVAAVAAADGSASIKAAEQMSNAQVRLAWDRVLAAKRLVDTADATTRPGLEQQLHDVVTRGVTEIRAAIGLLDQLAGYKSTLERESLRASAYKRLAMIHRVDQDAGSEKEAMGNAEKYYAEAFKSGDADKFYPGLNCIGVRLANGGLLDRDTLAAVRKNLDETARTDPNFWTVVGDAELRLYEALSSDTLAGDVCKKLIDAYKILYDRVQSRRRWDSVYDNAYFILERYRDVTPPSDSSVAAAEILRTIEAFVSGK